MKSVACLLCVGALALAGCNPSSNPPADPGAGAAGPGAPVTPVSANQPPALSPGAADPDSRVVATITGEPPITFGQLITPLIKAHGLTTLLQLVELELARDQVAQKRLTVTPADIEHERQVTLSHLFQQTDDKINAEIADAQVAHDDKRVKELQDELKDQHAILITQFLDNQHIAQSEFDTVMEINACLRKIAEPVVDAELTTDVVHRAFVEEYGQRRQVRYIQVSTIPEVNEVKRRLKTEDFSQVAREMSENVASAGLGGECRPFSRNDSYYPETFRSAAFALNNEGDVSDAVEYKNAFFIIKLEKKLDPIAVKFDDVKDTLRAELAENLTQQAITNLRDSLGALAMKNMHITDPIMKQQYLDRQAQQEAAIRDQKRIKEEMDLQHQRIWGKIDASTQPATAPAATQP